MAADDRDLNRDPITDEPGAHPVGTGVGAAGGAVAGAAAGTVAGPVGTMVGGVIGAVVGGLAGKAAAEAINPTAEEAHWRENYTREPYYEQGRSFDDYGPAYMHGVRGRMQHESDWDSAEPRLASEWSNARASSGLNWEQARPATRAAWDRVDLQRGGASGMGLSGPMAGEPAAVRADDLSRAGDGMHSPITGGTDMVGARGAMGNSLGVGAGTGMDSSYEAAGSAGVGTGSGMDRRSDADSRMSTGGSLSRSGTSSSMSDQNTGAAGALHRGWVAVRSALTTYDDKAVLQECERGEDNALARYRKALKQPLPPEVKQVVERQMQGVQRNHDEIKRLRDSA